MIGVAVGFGVTVVVELFNVIFIGVSSASILGFSLTEIQKAPFTSAKTVSLGGGFSTSSSYLVEISNNDNLPSGIYLSGSGTVEN